MAKNKHLHIRPAEIEDIPGILRVELDRNSERYENVPDLRANLVDIFKTRIEIAKGWMWVAEYRGDIVGFLSAMPTSSNMNHFKSWEESTNNGTLIDRFDPDGNNVYVVNLDVLREWTKKNAQYLLMLKLGQRVIAEGKSIIYFESRIPEFRQWVDENYGLNNWNNYSQEERDKIAKEYALLTTYKKGKNRPYDRLLNFYISNGFIPYRVVADAFYDGESLNYGVVFFTDNPVPKYLRLAPLNILIANFIGMLAKRPKMVSMLIR